MALRRPGPHRSCGAPRRRAELGSARSSAAALDEALPGSQPTLALQVALRQRQAIARPALARGLAAAPYKPRAGVEPHQHLAGLRALARLRVRPSTALLTWAARPSAARPRRRRQSCARRGCRRRPDDKAPGTGAAWRVKARQRGGDQA